MTDLPPLRLMGPAQKHAWTGLIWHFTRDGEWASNALIFWPEERTWQADVKVRRVKFEDRSIFWPFVPVETLTDLLPEEEKAKAIAASLGVYPWKNETC